MLPYLKLNSFERAFGNSGDTFKNNKLIYQYDSSGLSESNDVGTFTEALPAEHQVVFSNEAHLASTLAALAAVLSVLSWVGSPEKVWHCVVANKYLF